MMQTYDNKFKCGEGGRRTVSAAALIALAEVKEPVT
jgi:hypothetical protein